MVKNKLNETYLGDLYHFTTLSHLYSILKYNCIYRTIDDFGHKDRRMGDDVNVICLTRSLDSSYRKSINNVRITLDGNMLSSSLRNAKIHPYNYYETDEYDMLIECVILEEEYVIKTNSILSVEENQQGALGILRYGTTVSDYSKIPFELYDSEDLIASEFTKIEEGVYSTTLLRMITDVDEHGRLEDETQSLIGYVEFSIGNL